MHGPGRLPAADRQDRVRPDVRSLRLLPKIRPEEPGAPSASLRSPHGRPSSNPSPAPRSSSGASRSAPTTRAWLSAWQSGEAPRNAVAVAFTFNNLFTMVVFGIVEDSPNSFPRSGTSSRWRSRWSASTGIGSCSSPTDTATFIATCPSTAPAAAHVFERGPGLMAIGSPKTGGGRSHPPRSAHLQRRGRRLPRILGSSAPLRGAGGQHCSGAYDF